MLDLPLVFVDLETTGATAHFDRITEIGVVEVDCGQHRALLLTGAKGPRGN